MFASLMGFPGSIFDDFDRMRHEMDLLFGEPGLPSSIRSTFGRGFPPVNVGATSKVLEVFAFLPGIDPAALEVTLEKGVLTISGSRDSGLPQEDDKLTVYKRERFHGSFKRVISLTEEVDPSRVEADYRDGVLRITATRREETRPQRIKIK